MTKHARGQEGFTLIEIIAVLILLGILAAVAIPKYMDLTDTARKKAADGQIAEVKGRLNAALASYMLVNNGLKPSGSKELVDYANSLVSPEYACKTTGAPVTEGDFEFHCSVSVHGSLTTIKVTKVQGVTLGPLSSGTYDFSI